MSPAMVLRPIAALLLAILLAATVAGCGKRGALEAPEGKEKEYTYPRQYPR